MSLAVEKGEVYDIKGKVEESGEKFSITIPKGYGIRTGTTILYKEILNVIKEINPQLVSGEIGAAHSKKFIHIYKRAGNETSQNIRDSDLLVRVFTYVDENEFDGKGYTQFTFKNQMAMLILADKLFYGMSSGLAPNFRSKLCDIWKLNYHDPEFEWRIGRLTPLRDEELRI